MGVGAGAAAATLIYDIVLGLSAMTGADLPSPRAVGRDLLHALDVLDFALVVALVLALVAWGTGDRSRSSRSCVAMVGLAVPALHGLETVAAGAVFVSFALFAALPSPRRLRPWVERLTAASTAMALAAGAIVSAQRALLACVAVPLVVWMARRSSAGPNPMGAAQPSTSSE